MSAEHEKFGSTISGSRWFNATPTLRKTPVRPVQENWLCPIDNCDGVMVFNGMTWPTGDPGYHHTCDVCGFTAAIHGVRYPRISYQPIGLAGATAPEDKE